VNSIEQGRLGTILNKDFYDDEHALPSPRVQAWYRLRFGAEPEMIHDVCYEVKVIFSAYNLGEEEGE